MKTYFALFALAGTLAAQDAPKTDAPKSGAPKSALIGTSQGIYALAKGNILRSANKIPEDLWSFKPTPDVRTVGQLFAHIADGQYEFCGAAIEGKMLNKGIETSAKTKTEILAALKEAFAYCDAGYGQLTDASAVELVSAFGQKLTRIGLMDFNISHTLEHYGNLVTYMRLKGIVPPSSERSQ